MTLTMGLVLAGLSFLACKMGERAEADGRCPPGETCSDRTPMGLVFVGAHPFGDDAPATLLPTAIGGTQTISALYADSPNEPYVAGFDAQLLDTRVAAFASAQPTSVVLRGVSQGTSLLRLLEPRTNALLDRVEIEVAPIAGIALYPRELLGQGNSDARWALLAGGRAPLGVTLLDEDKRSLVDEGLELSSHGAEVARQAWDLYEVTAPYPDSVSFAVRAGGGLFTAEAHVVSSIDDILPSSHATVEGEPILVNLGGSPAKLCFLAEAGDRAVAGATWTFHPSEGIEIAPKDPEAAWEPPSCVTIAAKRLGHATLAVDASDREKTFNLVVVDE